MASKITALYSKIMAALNGELKIAIVNCNSLEKFSKWTVTIEVGKLCIWYVRSKLLPYLLFIEGTCSAFEI